jgi:hypothetical protein
MMYGDLLWDEVREKPHGYAWRNTTLNCQINFDDIIREAGGDESI